MGTTEDIPQGVDAIFSGLSNGITIFGGSMFGGLFPELKAEADRLVAQNGGAYAWAQTATNIGSTILQLVGGQRVFSAVGGAISGFTGQLAAAGIFAETLCVAGTVARIGGTVLATGFTVYSGYSAISHFGETWDHLTQGNYARAVDTFFHGTLDTVFAAMGGIAIGGLIRSVAHNGLRATYNQFFRSCFAAGTPLLMAHGGSKSIDQINPGDWALARSDADERGEIVPRQVEEVFVRSAELMELHVAGRIIKTTMEHPFWVVGAGWREAHELKVGDRFLSHGGQELTLDAIREMGEYATVYNLRVAEWHTYFVGCAEWGFSVWAHNACVQANDPAFVRTMEARGVKVRNGAMVDAETGRILTETEIRSVLSAFEAETAAIRQRIQSGGASPEDVAARTSEWRKHYGIDAEIPAEIAGSGELVRRFGTKAQIKDAKSHGIVFDPATGNGIPTTKMSFEPKYPDRIIHATGARSADYHMVIDISGKRVLRTTTGAGNTEIRVLETIWPEDILMIGRVPRH